MDTICPTEWSRRVWVVVHLATHSNTRNRSGLDVYAPYPSMAPELTKPGSSEPTTCVLNDAAQINVSTIGIGDAARSAQRSVRDSSCSAVIPIPALRIITVDRIAPRVRIHVPALRVVRAACCRAKRIGAGKPSLRRRHIPCPKVIEAARHGRTDPRAKPSAVRPSA